MTPLGSPLPPPIDASIGPASFALDVARIKARVDQALDAAAPHPSGIAAADWRAAALAARCSAVAPIRDQTLRAMLCGAIVLRDAGAVLAHCDAAAGTAARPDIAAPPLDDLIAGLRRAIGVPSPVPDQEVQP